MKKYLFQNEIYFPNLDPPKVILFKDIINLILKNGIRTTLGLCIAFFIIGVIFVPLTMLCYPDGISGAEPNYYLIFFLSIFILYFSSSILYTIIKSWKWYILYFKNYWEIRYIKEYSKKTNELNKKLKNKFLEEKIKNNSTLNISELYKSYEVELFNNLQNNYLSESLKKGKNISSYNIDEQIQNIKKRFDEIIVRKINTTF